MTVVGWVSRQRLLGEYAAADVFGLVSRCESFCLPALEAQTFGVPVVGSSTTAMVEVGGAGGVYVRPDDPEAVAEALKSAFKRREALASAAYANARRFSWDPDGNGVRGSDLRGRHRGRRPARVRAG